MHALIVQVFDHPFHALDLLVPAFSLVSGLFLLFSCRVILEEILGTDKMLDTFIDRYVRDG